MPRRSKRAAHHQAETPVNGTVEPLASPPQTQDPHPEPDGTPGEPERNGKAQSSASSSTRKKRAVFGRFVEAEPDESATEATSETAEAAGHPDSNDASEPSSGAGTAIESVAPSGTLIEAVGPIDTSGPQLTPDPGLYAVLGLDPSAPDAEIQTTYRRQAARLLGSGSNYIQALRQLNVAYEVLGNPVRRAEYDRVRLSQLRAPGPPTPFRGGSKAVIVPTRRTRPRQVVQPRYAGLPEVLVVLVVVGVAVLAGVLIVPRVNVNLSALIAFQNILPIASSRRVIDQTVTPAPSATPVVPTPTVRPGLTDRFSGTSVAVSDPKPHPNSAESVVIRMRRDGQPAANFDVWAVVQYRTIEERWPQSGAQKTDASGAATITFNIGPATLNYPVTVRVFTQVEDQQLSWSTSFTPN